LNKVDGLAEEMRGKIPEWDKFLEYVVNPLKKFKEECETHLKNIT